MTFKPLYDRIAVEAIEQEAKTAGGIYIPDTAKEKPVIGKVLYAGEGYRDESGKVTSMTVKVGDKVVFGKWAGNEVTIDGKKLIVMKESDVMGIIN